jgi:hypothetical protein
MSVVELTINSENTYSDAVYVSKDFVFSLISTSFSGIVTVQRSFESTLVIWRDVKSFDSTSIEENGVQPGGAWYRFGTKTGEYTSGSIVGRLSAVAL